MASKTRKVRPRRKRQTFKEALLAMPNGGTDRDFARVRQRACAVRIDRRVRPAKRGGESRVELAEEGAQMAREFSVIIERDVEGYYVASVPALRGCHTQATSLDELMTRVREAVELCLEVQGENVEPLDFVGVQKITLA